jgi:hypothetical protein
MAAAAAGNGRGVGDPISREEGVTTAYFTFGRFNPPTIGHKKMINTMIQKAEASSGGAGGGASKPDVYVFVTSTKYKTKVDQRKNPLKVYEKVYYLKKMFPDTSKVRIINTETTKTNSIFLVVNTLKGAGYTDIHFVVGSDRVKEFTETVRTFPEVTVESGGERDMDSDDMGAAAMSATKMREAAMEGNMKALRMGINKSINAGNLEILREQIVKGIEAVNANEGSAPAAAAAASAKRGTKRRAPSPPKANNAAGGTTRRPRRGGSSRRATRRSHRR